MAHEKEEEEKIKEKILRNVCFKISMLNHVKSVTICSMGRMSFEKMFYKDFYRKKVLFIIGYESPTNRRPPGEI